MPQRQVIMWELVGRLERLSVDQAFPGVSALRITLALDIFQNTYRHGYIRCTPEHLHEIEYHSHNAGC